MCPPSPNGDLETSENQPPRLERMNSFHVGPVQLPHPVRMPNGRLRMNSKIRSCSEDHSSGNYGQPAAGSSSSSSAKNISFKKGSYEAVREQSFFRSDRRALSLKNSSSDYSRRNTDELSFPSYDEGNEKYVFDQNWKFQYVHFFELQKNLSITEDRKVAKNKSRQCLLFPLTSDPRGRQFRGQECPPIAAPFLSMRFPNIQEWLNGLPSKVRYIKGPFFFALGGT